MRTVLALFWAITGRKFKHRSNLQPGRARKGRGKWSFLIHSTVITQGLKNIEALRSTGKQMTGEAQARRPLSSWSTCTNHCRRQMPHGSFEATKDRQDFCFTGLIWENGAAWSSIYLQHTFGSNKILPQDHSPLRNMVTCLFIFSQSLAFQISKAL